MSGYVSAKESKILFSRSGNACAFPGCSKTLIEPETDEDDPAVTGVMAHIVGEKRRGPRGQDNLPESERNKHPNLVLLCGDHHTIIDSQPNGYSIPILRQMKSDHEARVARAMGSDTKPAPKVATVKETIHSTLLPVTHLPAVVFAAPCLYSQDSFEEVKSLVSYPSRRGELAPFIMRGETLFAFHDLREEDNPFAQVIKAERTKLLRATELWGDPEGKRRYINLLNRSLFKYTGRLGIRYDTKHCRFYFPSDEVGGERTEAYRSLSGRRSKRRVAWEPKRKKTGEGKGFWWHLASGLRFHQFSDEQWCLSIRPERHLTKDGETPLPPERIGRRVTRLKAKMYNDLYLNEVNFWRECLSKGQPRVRLDFGAQSAIVEARFLTTQTSWPGIADDDKPFENQVYEEDLFTLSDLEEATSGDEVDWEALGEVEEYDD